MRSEDRKAIERCARRLSIASLQSSYQDIFDVYADEPEGQFFRDIAFATGAIYKTMSDQARTPPDNTDDNGEIGG